MSNPTTDTLSVDRALVDESGWSHEFETLYDGVPHRNDPTSIPTRVSIDGRPGIRLPGDGHLLSEFASNLGSHLAAAGIFCRNGYATTVARSGHEFELVTTSWLPSWLEKHVVPFKVVGKHDLRITHSMKEETAKAVLASPQFLEALPEVERFHPCPMPVLRSDGSLALLQHGLDLESKTFTADPGFELKLKPVPVAARFLRKILREFAWADDGGRSMGVHVAAMLTVFSRALIPHGSQCPVFIYVANAEGAGKTLLASLAGVAYPSVAAEAAPTTEEEWQKKLLVLTISGRRLMLLDNCKGHLQSPSLEAYTTSSSYRGRILGASKEFEGDAGATILITGNALTISGDLRRRSLFVELFLSELRAEDRRYSRILDQDAIQGLRPQILSALWSIVHGWDAAGRSSASRPHSSFPRWCDIIGGMVEFAGFACPVQPAAIEGMGDTDTADFSSLAGAMDPGHGYTFEGLVLLAEQHGLFENALKDRDHDGRLTNRARSIFSKLIKRFDHRRVSESGVFQIEGHGHAKRYVIRLHGRHGEHGIPAATEN